MAKEVSELSLPVPWGHIRGKVWGPDHGHPVLCLHGWSDNCGAFNNLIPLLPKECKYVAMDLAGHGLSSHHPPGHLYNIPDYVAGVSRVVKALQLNKFSIVGHSMGGEIAALFTALYPELVDALVLLDTLGFPPTDSTEIPKVMRQGMDEVFRYEKRTQEINRVYTYEKAVEKRLATNSALSEQSAHILLERGLVQVEGGFVFSRDLRVNFKNIARIGLEQSLEFLSRIKAPVLVVLTEDGFDRTLSEPDQNKFTSTLLQRFKDQKHTVMTVPGDHHVHLDKPEVVAPLVSDFLRSQVLSQSALREHKL